jgi:hypothetical protein
MPPTSRGRSRVSKPYSSHRAMNTPAARVNILDKLNPWIVANYAFGVLFVPLGYLVARVLAERCHRHRWWQAVLDISGRSLKVAALDVERWASLQQEASSHSD